MRKLLILALALLPFLFIESSFAQTFSVDLGEDTGSTTSRLLQMVALITILSLAPSILIMMTSFVRIIVVLSLLRSAMGIQQTPPNPVLISLALFLTLFIMTPVFERAYEEGIDPLIKEEIELEDAFHKSVQPFKTFMLAQLRDKDLSLFHEMAGSPQVEDPEAMPLHIVIPAYMISELRRAFEIGFLIFIPFLIIDMMVAATLMSMGMMLLPPVLISLPFKVVFFVLVDGWYMLSESLIKSYAL